MNEVLMMKMVAAVDVAHDLMMTVAAAVATTVAAAAQDRTTTWTGAAAVSYRQVLKEKKTECSNSNPHMTSEKKNERRELFVF